MSASSAISGNGDGPMAYHVSEMGSHSWSDNYSFLGSEINSQNGYNPIGRNFESLIPEAGHSYGSSKQAAPAKQSEKEKALNRDFESYLANRDHGIQAPLMRQ
jgi:hypothetical protein